MTLCHRCGEPVPEGAGFCPNCGAAQLYLSVEDGPEMGLPESGTPPPPKPGLVEWPVALRGVAIVAAVGFLLFAGGNWIHFLGMLSFVFVLSAGQLAVDLYRRRRPLARLNAAIGARIGAVTGIVLAATNTMAISLTSWMERFPLHRGAQIDADYQASIQLMQPLLEQMAGADKAAEQIRLLMIPEYRAGQELGGIIFLTVLTFVAVTICGALSGALNSRRRMTR